MAKPITRAKLATLHTLGTVLCALEEFIERGDKDLALRCVKDILRFIDREIGPAWSKSYRDDFGKDFEKIERKVRESLAYERTRGA